MSATQTRPRGFTYLDADLPQIWVANIRHEQALGNVVHVASVMRGRTPIALANVVRDALQVLVVQFAVTAVKTRVVQRALSYIIFLSLATSLGKKAVYACI